MFNTNVHQLECKYYCNETREFQTFKNYIQSTELTNHLRTLPNIPNDIPLFILHERSEEARQDISFGEHENISGWRNKLKNKTRSIVSNNSLIRSIHSFMDSCGLMERKPKPKLQICERSFGSNSNELLLLQPNTSTAQYSEEAIFQKYYQPYFDERQIFATKIKNKKGKKAHIKISDKAPEINSLEDLEYSPKRTPSTVSTLSTATVKSLSKRSSDQSFYDLETYKSEHQDISITNSIRRTNQTVCPGPCVEPTTISDSFKKLPTIQNSKHMPAIRKRSREDDINNYWTNRHLNSLESTDTKKKERKKRWCKKKEPLLEIKDNNVSKQDSKQSVFNQSFVKESDVESDSTGCTKMEIGEGKQRCSKYKQGSNLSIKTFMGIDIAPCNTTCNVQDSVGINTKKIKFHHKKTTTGQKNSSEHDPMMLLDKSCTVCSNNNNKVQNVPMQFRKPITQPVLGYCSMNRRETKGTQYALAKITHFADYSTYEIMAPYKSPPKDVPTCIAEIFVLSRKQKFLSMHLKK